MTASFAPAMSGRFQATYCFEEVGLPSGMCGCPVQGQCSKSTKGKEEGLVIEAISFLFLVASCYY